MRLVCVSDTHGRLPNIEDVPDGDVFIHAGDITSYHSGYKDNDLYELEYLEAFMRELPHRVKIVIPGNHDWCFYNDMIKHRSIAMIKSAIYLQDESVDIMGLKFYGTPWTPTFFDWAFMADDGEALDSKFSLIPDSTDVLISHGPSFGFLDRNQSGFNCGSESLRQAVDRVKPKVHVFGHIHQGYGESVMRHKEGGSTIIVNAATNGDPSKKPIVIDL